MHDNEEYLNIHQQRFDNTLEFIKTNSLVQNGDRVLSLGGPSFFGEILHNSFDLRLDETDCDLRYDLPLSDDQYDAILCLEVIEHIKDQETKNEDEIAIFTGSGIKNLIRESARVLKPNGSLIITTPNLHCYKTMYNWAKYDDLFTYPLHPRELSEKYLVSKLNNYFEDVESDYFTSWSCHSTPKYFMDIMETFLNTHNINTRNRREDNLILVAKKPKPTPRGNLERIQKANEILNDSIIDSRNDLSEYFCNHPFDNFEPRENGDVGVCCISWLPKTIGNLNESSFDEVYNSDIAKEIRTSILDGSFKYCDHRVCPKIISKTLPKKSEVTNKSHRDIIDNHKTTMDYPTFINFLNDDSCNMSCPSCRIQKINYFSGEKYDKRLAAHEKLVDGILEKYDGRPCLFSVTGSGDPFGSKIYRDFLFNFDGEKYPNIQFSLQTNGVMLTPHTWQNINKIHNNIHWIIISFDAATEDTYKIVRRGGDWKTLNANVDFLCTQKQYIDCLQLDFVVQDYNYKEMPDFVRMAKNFGKVDFVAFSMITDWGTYTNDDFKKRAIWRKEHPLFDDFLRVLRDNELDTGFIKWGNLKEYYNMANKCD